MWESSGEIENDFFFAPCLFYFVCIGVVKTDSSLFDVFTFLFHIDKYKCFSTLMDEGISFF